jgi:hypothetical protein
MVWKMMRLELRIVRASIRTYKRFGCLDDGLDLARAKERAVVKEMKNIEQKETKETKAG